MNTTLNEKYQRHLPIQVRLEYYRQFLTRGGVGFILGQHLGWESNELLKFSLKDCGFTSKEIKKILK